MQTDDRWIIRYGIYRTIRGRRWTKKPKASHGADTIGLWLFVAAVMEFPLWFLEWCSRGTILAGWFLYMMVLVGVVCLAGIRLALKGRNS